MAAPSTGTFRTTLPPVADYALTSSSLQAHFKLTSSSLQAQAEPKPAIGRPHEVFGSDLPRKRHLLDLQTVLKAIRRD